MVVSILISLNAVAWTAQQLNVAELVMLFSVEADSLLGAAFVVVVALWDDAVEFKVIVRAALSALAAKRFLKRGVCPLGPITLMRCHF